MARQNAELATSVLQVGMQALAPRMRKEKKPAAAKDEDAAAQPAKNPKAAEQKEYRGLLWEGHLERWQTNWKDFPAELLMEILHDLDATTWNVTRLVEHPQAGA